MSAVSEYKEYWVCVEILDFGYHLVDGCLLEVVVVDEGFWRMTSEMMEKMECCLEMLLSRKRHIFA